MGTLDRYRITFGDYHYTTEKDTRYALLHLMLFCIYLGCVTTVGKNLIVPQQHFFIRGVRNLIETPGYLDNDTQISFKTVFTVPDFWDFMQFAFLPMLHGNINNHSLDHYHEPLFFRGVPNLAYRFFLRENLLLGPPRLRQVRVKRGTCEVKTSFNRYFNECVAAYSKSIEYTEPVYKGTKYYTMGELKSKPIRATQHTYRSGGYVKLLSYESEKNRAIIQYLRSIKWLDRASRVVVLELNMLNLNLDLILITKLIFEIMPTGLINTKYSSKSFYLGPMSGGLATECAIIVYMINVYYTYLEIKKIIRISFRLYFTKFSTYFFLPNIIICYNLVYVHIISVVYSARCKSAIYSKIDQFIPLDDLLYIFWTQQILIGFLSYFGWIGLQVYMDFVPLLRTMGCCIRMAIPDLIAIAIMLLVAFLAFALLGVYLFGYTNSNFKNLSSALLTMVRMIVRDFNYFELAQESPGLSFVYFLTYVLFIFFFVFNIIIIVIVLAYRSATATITYKPSFLLYYIRKQIFRMTCGLCKPPRHPELNDDHLSNPFNVDRLQHLYIIREYVEIESDLNILQVRLNLIENTLYRFTNNIECIIDDMKKEINQKKKT